ncbi:MAG TPA: histidine--tRNA ligase [Patescibacteria group bacterium]|jgi:histidyl-tRNA synthetase|nr:histidine--tRNA ligase [Patescibacteria group bacterium]
MKIEPRTLKGFRDFLPKEMRKRQYVLGTLKRVFKSYGFEPLETPALEYEDILAGKYGNEGDKLMYRFVDNGDRKVAMRYDQTVPLARVVAQYQNELPMPFKRYQIQNVWRAENTQKGRYREFVQCDADIIGSSSPLADVEIIKLVLAIYQALNLDVTIKINDRANLANLDKKYIAAIDKLEKIGESAVLSEMIEKGMEDVDAKKALRELQNKPQTETITQILKSLEQMGCDMSKIQYEPTLARGLDYYTGIIFETVAQGGTGSICSGGRYDNLIGMFAGRDFSAVGFGLGFDRTIEVLEEQNKIPNLFSTTKVLITNSGKALEIAEKLRTENINTEIYLGEKDLEKQLKYADKKQIPFVVIVDAEKLILKDMEKRTQEELTFDQILKHLV